jgi:sarcosine oxidase
VSCDAEVVVVGAGVMGLATARALARAGLDVAVLEQFELGHDRGSSHGTSRIFRLSYPDAEWVRLAQEALPLSVDLGDWGPNRDALAACGVAHEVLDRAEAERRFGLRLEPGEQALLQPEGGIALADRTLEALAASAQEHGARVLERSRAVGVAEHGDGVEVELETGVLRAGAAVVTAGAWAPRLVELAEALPTRETTAYFAHEGPIPSLIDSTLAGVHGYALAAPGAGTKAGVHKTGPRTDPDAPGEPDAEVARAAGEWLARRFPGLPPEPTRVETCLYTNLPDDRFTCERRGRIVVGSPCSGHGFKFAPLLGARLGALARSAL